MNRTIAILGGTGPTGTGLALRLARAGETIIIGSRDATRAKKTAEDISRRTGKAVTGDENAAALAQAQVAILTVPFISQAELLKSLKPAFPAGCVLIDATVPLASTVGGRSTRVLGVWEGSAAEQAASLVPKGVTVAAAFHNVSADALAGDHTLDCDVIVCSDDDAARQLASELAEKIPGVRAVNGGRLENARIVEQVTALLIGINMRYKVHGAGLRITGI